MKKLITIEVSDDSDVDYALLLRDALGEFIDTRHDSKGYTDYEANMVKRYVEKRYPYLSKGADIKKVIDDVTVRVAAAKEMKANIKVYKET